MNRAHFSVRFRKELIKAAVPYNGDLPACWGRLIDDDPIWTSPSVKFDGIKRTVGFDTSDSIDFSVELLES